MPRIRISEEDSVGYFNPRFQRGLYGMGQWDLTQGPAQGDPAAMREYLSSFKRAEAEISYLGAATPSNWEVRINDALSLIPNEFKTLDAMVKGRTGNPDAEDQLYKLWGSVHSKVIDMLNNKPTVLAQLADKGSIFLTDFFGGAQAAYQDFAAWAIQNAGPTLKKYWQAVSYVNELNNNLNQIKATGIATADDIASQQSKIDMAQSTLNAIRSGFKSVSGGLDIDQMAQTEYGAFTNLAWPPLPVVAAVAIAIAATLIVVGAVAILEINKLTVTGGQIAADTTAAALKKAQQLVDDAKNTVDKYMPWIIGGGVIALGSIGYFFYLASRRDK
jgi:hypothetical protein